MNAVAPPAGNRRVAMLAGIGLLATVTVGLVWAAIATPSALTTADAVLLGVVEGLTEYLPISSTGHLTVTQRLLGIGDTAAERPAADAYAIVIQAGAILAVIVLYHGRIRRLLRGLVGRDPAGRRLLTALVASLLPAAAIGLVLGDTIKEQLFGVGPVAAAWLVGAGAIFLLAPRWQGGTGSLDAMGVRDGLVIGLAQALALWPGVSRSLVTILAALALGYAMEAAVEYSFLLGLGTLGAATVYEAISDGDTIIETFGVVAPLLGFAAAFLSAVVAIRWMVSYLQSHGLAIFAWYRLLVGALAIGLLAMGVV